MNDAWADHVAALGTVFIGDAAGWNNPIIGQGLAIALRDARTVAEILTSSNDWSERQFDGYRDERAERMRRLRFVAELTTDMRATFTPEAVERRRRWLDLRATDPLAWAPIVAELVGPEKGPGAAFTDDNRNRLLDL
jgi:menaquinone-9 beta-reductase